MSPRFVDDLECRCLELERDRLCLCDEEEDLWCFRDDFPDTMEAPSQPSKKPIIACLAVLKLVNLNRKPVNS